MTPPAARRWTPPEAWHLAEIAKRSLRVDAPAAVEIHASSTALTLEITIPGGAGTISLDVPPDLRWRGTWVLEVTPPQEAPRLLAPGAPPIPISHAGEAHVRVRPLVRALSLEHPGAPEPITPIVELSDNRFTTQSSADWSFGARPATLASVPTDVQCDPYWQVDLEKPHFLSSVRLELAPLPEGASISLRAAWYPRPDGELPETTMRLDEPELEVTRTPEKTIVRAAPRWVARYVRVELRGVAASLHVRASEIHGVSPFAETLRASYRRALTLFAEQTVFLAPRERDGRLEFVPISTYEDLRRQSSALVRAWRAALGEVVDRPFVALVTRNRPEWVVADLACVEAGWVVVPIAPTEPEDRLRDVFRRTPIAIALVEPDLEARVRALAAVCPTLRVVTSCGAGFAALVASGGGPVTAPDVQARDLPAEEELYSIGLTSGSTGSPKGAMRSYATFHAMVRTYGVAQPAVYLSFQPLSHLSERMFQPAVLLQGGRVAFSRGGAHVLEELRALAPSGLGAVPRLYDQVFASYRRALARLEAEEPETPFATLEARALADARGAFGHRIQGISVGSAPVSPEVLAFLRRCFADIWVTEAYGSTEVGTIAVDGKIQSHVDVRLMPVDGVASGETLGEICVRSPHAILGYFGDEEATRSTIDAEGYVHTGDLGERMADGTVRVVGRVKNAVKLANGEFVSAERIEAALAGADTVDVVYAHVEPGAASVSAVILPRAGARLDAVEADIRAHGLRAGLGPMEIPARVVLLRAPPTVENGLLTASGKLARRAFAERLAAELAAGPTASPAPARESAARGGLGARLAAIASRVVQRRVSAGEPLAAAVDSLGAAEILAVASAELGRAVALEDWFASSTLDELAARLEAVGGGVARALEAARRDVEAELPLPGPSGRARAAGAGRRACVLTGATGFLGVHLLEALQSAAQIDRIVCLVRGDAEARLVSAAARAGFAIDAARVSALRSDLSAPRLGLSDEAWADLVSRTDVVLHAGATVSWLASYDALRGTNVDGTRAVLALASEAGAALHFVSTISTAPSDGDERTSLPIEIAARSSPYGLTKWVAEALVRRAALPGAIHRPAMIASHTTRGTPNDHDYLQRYMRHCLARGAYLDDPSERLDMTPVDHVARAVVALLDGRASPPPVLHLVNVHRSMTYAELGRAMSAWRVKRGAGAPLEPLAYGAFRATVIAGGTPLAPLAGYFPESRFGLVMGPWPCAVTEAALSRAGITPPVIDADYVDRVMDWMHRLDRSQTGP